MSDQRRYCHGTNKQGGGCRAAATENGYCYLHANPEKAAELGRSGGRKNRHVVDENPTPLPPLTSIASLKEAVAITIVDVRSRRLDARAAAALPSLFNTLIRAIQAGQLEDKIQALQEQIQELTVKANQWVKRAEDDPAQ